MNDCVDDTTPLLQPFVRGSSQRTTVRWCRPSLEACTHTPKHVPSCKPPLPPRPSESRHRSAPLRRSVSVTEGREVDASDVPHWSLAVSQDVRDGGRGEGWRPPSAIPTLHRGYSSSSAEDGASLHQSDAQGQVHGGSEGCYPRNGYQFASMPRRRLTPPASPDTRWSGFATFRRRPPSPSPSRRPAPQTEDRTSARSENSNYSKPSNSVENSFIRRLCTRTGRSQTPPPPCSSPLLSPVTYKRDISSNTQSPGTFRRYGSVPMKKSEPPPQQMLGDLGRSRSFRYPGRYSALTSQLPVLSHAHTHMKAHPLAYHESHRHFTPDERHSDGWEGATPPVQRRDLLAHVHSDPHRTTLSERRGSRRFSYLRGPLTTSDKEQQTHRHLTNTLSGDLTPTSPPITPTTAAPCSPSASRRPPGSSDLNDGSPPGGSWDRSYSGTLDDSGGGSRHNKSGSPSLNLSRVSSDSGYSTCSNSSGPSRSLSIISDSEGEMISWFCSHMNLTEEKSLEAKSPTDHFSYLMEKEGEYLACLRSMMTDYQDMNHKTPSLIRQHFDLIFKQVAVIYAFQMVLQDDLRETRGRPDQLARVFTNEQFQCYGRYMVMTPAVQRDLLQYASHFKEHFPDLKRNILKPSLRINFYAMILESFKKEASEEVRSQLQAAIDYLNQVKRKANTEMTLNTVIHSPVDLRLGGDMLYIGELYYLSGGSLQKKKYQVILFENLLVITSMKTPYFKYKTHYRVEQLESVVASGENELFLNVLSEGQTQLATLKFKIKSTKIRDEWIKELQKITRRNTRLTHGRGPVNLLHIPRQQFRTLPLDLCRVFPLLKEVVTDDPLDESTKESLDGFSLSNMVFYEEKYLNKLSSLLNPESQRPPEPLCDLLEKLHRLHSREILPALQRSYKVSDFLDYLAESLDELSVYIDYLVIRSQLTVKLDEAPQAGPYICPVQHVFGIYFGLMKELCSSEKCKKSAKRVIKGLRENIMLAQLQVLHEAIVSGRVDFQRSGRLLLYSPLDVRTRKKEIRAGEYIVLLFENVIILTRPKQPYYEYVMDIWLDQVNLGPPASHDCTFRLEVRQGGRKEPVTYELCAHSVEVKQEWHKRLHQQMLVQVEKIRKHVTPTGEAPGGGYH